MQTPQQEDANTAQELPFEPEYIEEDSHGGQPFIPDEGMEANREHIMAENAHDLVLGESGAEVMCIEANEENLYMFGSPGEPGIQMDFQPAIQLCSSQPAEMNEAQRPIRVS